MTFVIMLENELGAVTSEIEELRAQEKAIRAQAEERLRSVSQNLVRLQARMRHIQALLALEGGRPAESGSAAAVSRREPSLDDVAYAFGLREQPLPDAAYELLAETQQEYHYQELAAELQLRGLHVAGKDPAKNLVAHIHRDPRFIRPRRGVYGLAEWYPKGTASVGVRHRRKRAKPRPRARAGK